MKSLAKRPIGLWVAGFWTLLLGVLELSGIRALTGVLSGTPAEGWDPGLAMMFAAGYVVVFLVEVAIVPILVIAACLQAIAARVGPNCQRDVPRVML